MFTSTISDSLMEAMTTALKPKLKENTIVQSEFTEIHSNQLLTKNHKFLRDVGVEGSYHDRDLFLKSGYKQYPPPVISKCDFLPNKFVEHLMKNKKPSSAGVKYQFGDFITNMEGIFHTMISPICNIVLTADLYQDKQENESISLEGQGRNVVLTTTIQPDFETEHVMLQLTKVQKKEIRGKKLDLENWKFFHQMMNDKEITHKNFSTKLKDYEEKLKKHLIYLLTFENKLPSLSAVKKNVMSLEACIDFMQRMIKTNFMISLTNYFVKLDSNVISLEILFNIFVHQTRNEFSFFEQNLTQGYVYTINPSKDYVIQLGFDSISIFDRLHVLVLQYLDVKMYKNLKSIVVSTEDKDVFDLYEFIFSKSEIDVLPYKSIIGEDKKYKSDFPYALIIHNYSDAFGENIQTDESMSVNGLIGSHSNAACCLSCERKDLCDYIM
eukprot:gene6911-11074_t